MSRADHLLQSIVATLRANEDVCAAWLAGSRGRGTHDEFSDIDIWIAVDDDAMPPIIHDPLVFVHEIGPTLMHIPDPAFAPPGGAFVSSWVPVDDEFVQIDWYIAPSTTAERAVDTQVMFGDVALLIPTDHTGAPNTSRVAKAQDNLSLALRKISDMVKHARRGHFWDVANSARNTDKCLNNARSFLTTGSARTFVASQDSLLQEPPPATVGEVQHLALKLLDEVGRLDAQSGEELSVAITAMRSVIHNWRNTDWKPTEEC